MAKFRVTLNYCIWKTHVYELDIPSAQVEEFREDPDEFYCEKDQVSEDLGDVMNGTWETVIDEINVLDQIIEEISD